MASASPQVNPTPQPDPTNQDQLGIRVYTHSSFFYLWPVWVFGYVMALVTWFGGVPVELGDPQPVLIYPHYSLGLLYTLVVFLVMVITNIPVRGVWSLVVILALMFLALLFAYLDWWDDILSFLPNLSVHMNFGFYALLATLVFIVWAVTFLVYDRLSYWQITPGQTTFVTVVGGGQRSYDTHGIVVEKLQEDMFRHWILGLGSGDVHMIMGGAERTELVLSNVLFVDYKIKRIQDFVAQEPTQ